MAKPQQNQQPHQHRKHYFIYTSSALLCGVTILMICGTASANEKNKNATGSHNYTTKYTLPIEQRLRRDIPAAKTDVLQTIVVAHSETGESEGIPGKKIHLSSRNDLEGNFNNLNKELNIYKRAPNGFIGMRGKKENGNDYFNPNAIDWNFGPLLHQTLEENDEDSAYAEKERYKKAPTAFYGVRGKKIPNRSGNDYSRLSDMVQELEEERLRERMLENFIGRLAVATAEENEINKRAPTGFTGLRGKRPSWEWNSNSQQLNDENELESYEKRAPVNAFVGVRGKKDVKNQQDVEQTLFKRSPSESFSGKRRLTDFNNKFVAVRGKKTLTQENTDEERGQAQTQLVERQRLRYLVNLLPSLVDSAQNEKRAPSGFMGMRGKRSAILNAATAQIGITG